jgi:hypothetical protein
MPAAKKARLSPDAGHSAAGQEPWQGTSSEQTAQEGLGTQQGESLEGAQYDNDLTYQQELDRLLQAGRKLSRRVPTVRDRDVFFQV